MKEVLCNYALIRFLPYRETGEFVNVGLVIYCPEINLFSFQLSEARNRRIRGFFPELDRVVYTAAITSMSRELNRYRNDQYLFTEGRKITDSDVSNGLTTFRNLLRRRETLMHFAEPGMVVADPHEVLNQLFERYVNRNFARPKEYQERVMQRRLDRWLRDWNFRDKYVTNQRVGNDIFHLRLPFVHLNDQRAIKAIKPLDLDKVETTQIFEHGDAWVQRVRRLKTVGHLPDQMIFTVKMPAVGEQLKAAEEICLALGSENTEVVQFDDIAKLRPLAKV